MAGPNFDVEGLRFWIGATDRPSMDRWSQMQHVSELALRAEGYQAGEINWLLHKGDVPRYKSGRVDPQVDVADGRLNENQEFANIRIAAAINTDDDKFVAHAIAADNTSGKPAFIRKAKMRIHPDLPVPKLGHRHYVWEREVMVSPGFQRRGIAHVLTYMLLNERLPKQPYSVYERDPTPSDIEHLSSLGIVETGYRMKEVFGAGSTPVRLTRFEATRAEDVKKNIWSLPGASEAIVAAINSTVR